MKPAVLIKIVFMLLVAASSFAQKDDLMVRLKGYDLSAVLHPDGIADDSGVVIESPEPLGYIGDDYQRFQIHFASFSQSGSNPLVYNVTGKTKVKGNICSFKGTVEVVAIENDDNQEDFMGSGMKAVVIVSHVTLYEDRSQKGSGTITGTLATSAYFDGNGKLHYNALMLVADGYANNQFTGTWTSYKSGISKTCNWGDYRIPDSNQLDTGAGAFTVDDKYVNNGWESYRNSYCCGSDAEREAALKEEEAKWWQ